MSYWKHKTQRGGHVGLGLRTNVPVREDGIFEVPDDAGLDDRLLAAGHEKLKGNPPPLKTAHAKPPITAKEKRMEERRARRRKEEHERAKEEAAFRPGSPKREEQADNANQVRSVKKAADKAARNAEAEHAHEGTRALEQAKHAEAERKLALRERLEAEHTEARLDAERADTATAKHDAHKAAAHKGEDDREAARKAKNPGHGTTHPPAERTTTAGSAATPDAPGASRTAAGTPTGKAKTPPEK